MNQSPVPTHRVSAIPFPERYGLPAKPEGSPPAVQDAYRQTAFVLGEDLRLFEEGMNLQLRIVRDASPSAFRTHPYAALIGLWSRTFLGLADACVLVSRGSYPSCPPLVRAACEFVAAQHQLHATDMEEFMEWLAGNLKPSEEHKAFEFGFGRYFAGERLAADERLRSVYRPASELGRPSFGATLLQIGPESNNRHLALAFGDGSFHVGWAEIVLGWLLALCERQLEVSVRADDVYPIEEEIRGTYADFAVRVDQALGRPGRCAVDEIDEGGVKRLLARDFRRAPSGAPKRFLL